MVAVAEGEEEGEPGSSKKKMKLKKNKDVETEGTSSQKVFEVKDIEPAPQERAQFVLIQR